MTSMLLQNVHCGMEKYPKHCFPRLQVMEKLIGMLQASKPLIRYLQHAVCIISK